MPTLHLLGTGAALADASRTTTMLAFENETATLVVDCGGDVVQRLLVADLDLERIEGLILTHEHPDHVGGFPLFMEKIWLAGRRRPIAVYGPEAALSQARRIFESFDTSGWEGMPQIEWHEVELRQGAEVLAARGWRVSAAPGKHSVPVIGIRVEDTDGGGVVAYSADTEKAESIVILARDADILVHEASGGFSGHSSVADATAVAAEAGAKQLILVHLPPDPSGQELEQTRREFHASEYGSDGDRFDF
jgi:ribonuclease Z